jgi:hypothetical protein
MDRVQWERDALRELATLWANADAEIRRRITDAEKETVAWRPWLPCQRATELM